MQLQLEWHRGCDGRASDNDDDDNRNDNNRNSHYVQRESSGDDYDVADADDGEKQRANMNGKRFSFCFC